MRKWMYRVFGIYMIILLALVLYAQIYLSQAYLKEYYSKYIIEDLGKFLDDKWKEGEPIELSKDEIIAAIQGNRFFYMLKNNRLISPYKNDIMDKYMTDREKEHGIDKGEVLELVSKKSQDKSIVYKTRIEDDLKYETTIVPYTNKSDVKFIIIDGRYGDISKIRWTASITLAIPVLAGMIISLIIIFFLSKGLNRALSTLTEQTQRMIHMDFQPIDVEVKGTSEILILKNAMNTLARKLQNALTDLNKTNYQLSMELDQKRKKEQAMQQFLSDVSHELKTPITIINGHAEALMDDVGDSYYYSSCILDEANRMEAMVKDLLGYVKWEWRDDERDEAFSELLDIGSIVKDEKVRYTQMLASHGQEMIINHYPVPKLYASRHAITRLVKNLMYNAIIHGNEHTQIIINIDVDEENILLVFYNECNKIEKDELEHIWQPFYKTDKARHRIESGTGLGLPMVKRIVDSYGGSVLAEYKEKGITFQVKIPFYNELEITTVTSDKK